jgi:hypothetical protein
MSARPSRTTIAGMTNQLLTSAIATERSRDLQAVAAHARLVREATTPASPDTTPTAPTGLRGLIRRARPA